MRKKYNSCWMMMKSTDTSSSQPWKLQLGNKIALWPLILVTVPEAPGCRISAIP